MKITIEHETADEAAKMPEAKTYSLQGPFALVSKGPMHIHLAGPDAAGELIGALANLDATIRAKVTAGETVAALMQQQQAIAQQQQALAIANEIKRNGQPLRIHRG